MEIRDQANKEEIKDDAMTRNGTCFEDHNAAKTRVLGYVNVQGSELVDDVIQCRHILHQLLVFTGA